jgi:uncharacterized protein (TIGR04255 family)
MTKNSIPKKLNKEPIVEAVCEFRFEASAALSKVLPGILYTVLKGEKTIEDTPAAQLPDQLIKSDPSLRFHPLNVMNWNDYKILFSNHSILISTSIPYPGWSNFKDNILTIMSAIMDSGTVKSITRYSIKFQDLIVAEGRKEAVDNIDLKLTLGGVDLHDQNYNVKIESQKDDKIHIIHVLAPAVVENHSSLPSSTGTLLITDSICTPESPIEPTAFTSVIPDDLELLHLENKNLFFTCLSKQGLDSLEPIYEN